MEKTNLEKAWYAVQQGNKVTNSDWGNNHYLQATAYALIAIAETLAQINEKMDAADARDSLAESVALYTPSKEG